MKPHPDEEETTGKGPNAGPVLQIYESGQGISSDEKESDLQEAREQATGMPESTVLAGPGYFPMSYNCTHKPIITQLLLLRNLIISGLELKLLSQLQVPRPSK